MQIMKNFIVLLGLSVMVGMAITLTGCEPKTPIGKVFFVTPKNGTTVRQTFAIVGGFESLKLTPAGTVNEKGGHLHLLIDTDLPPLDKPIPPGPAIDRTGHADMQGGQQFLHIASGASDIRVTLDPGEHTLQLLLGDHNHVPHDPPVFSEKITITVKPEREEVITKIPKGSGGERPDVSRGLE
ncbi:MAG: DUF4399 domain-containing protein [Pseudomonadota bacterium]